MSDTKKATPTLTRRQAYIVQLINSSDRLTREQLQKSVGMRYDVSKPTLLRDINELIRYLIIRDEGTGRSTAYTALSGSHLSRMFDLDVYFDEPQELRRNVRSSFDFGLYDRLHDLFSPEESSYLDNVTRDFSQVTGQLPPDILRRELERFVVELSWKSSLIEGNTFSLLETESLIVNNILPAGHDAHESMMILNHKATFDAILAAPEDFKVLTVSKIQQLHNLLTLNLEITAGVRTHAVGITGTQYRPLDNQFEIIEALEKLVRTINSVTNPFEKALIAHCMISYIQPYADGNKRTARLLTNAILLAHNLFPLSYRSVHVDEYKKALILYYEQQSLYHIKRLFIEQVAFTNQTYFL